MPKRDDFQEKKAIIRESLVKWFASSVQYCDGQFYRVTDKERRIVRKLPTDECAHEIRSQSRRIAESPGYGSMYQLWAADVKQVLEHAETVARDRKDEHIVAVGDTPLDGDYSGRAFAINRLPVDFKLPQTIAKEDWPAALDAIMAELPEFYHDLRSRVVCPEMWDILTCFIGRVISEDAPSEQFCYWFGEGGDGKGSLTDLLFRHMPETSVPIAHDNFESRFGAGVYGEKRFVRIDEAPPGNFFTERVKEVTGGAKFISQERKGKDAVTIRSRLAIMFTSNYSPAFDDSMAQRRRIRVIECSQRTSKARNVDDELEASLGAFLGYCLINYARHGKVIPPNNDEYLERLCADTNLRADSWIIDNIEYDAGGWVPSTDISTAFAKTNRTSKLTFERMMKRLAVVVQRMSTDGGVVMARTKGNRRGWQNIRIKHNGFGFGLKLL